MRFAGFVQRCHPVDEVGNNVNGMEAWDNDYLAMWSPEVILKWGCITLPSIEALLPDYINKRAALAPSHRDEVGLPAMI